MNVNKRLYQAVMDDINYAQYRVAQSNRELRFYHERLAELFATKHLIEQQIEDERKAQLNWRKLEEAAIRDAATKQEGD